MLWWFFAGVLQFEVSGMVACFGVVHLARWLRSCYGLGSRWYGGVFSMEVVTGSWGLRYVGVPKVSVHHGMGIVLGRGLWVTSLRGHS